MKLFYFSCLIIFFTGLFFVNLSSCSQPKKSSSDKNEVTLKSSMENTSKPFVRYWWFASEIKKEDVKYNLDWIKENGFGGVEIAWVYPLNSMDKSLDTTYTPRYKWLGKDWQEVVDYAIRYADSIGLACDMTMGTLWPFGDSYVTYEQAAQRFGVDERQEISRSWEYPEKSYVVDHLNPIHYNKYFDRVLDSFPHPRTKIPQSYFVDSWEVETKKMWTDSLKEEFEQKYGYDISPFMDVLYKTSNKHQLYDYMSLISEKTIAFYKDFDKVLNEKGIFSRGQCSGAPCDIISAYATLDIPEGEAMLYEPEFNSIPASAALLSNKNVVSAETFTCLYGWPRNYIREEQSADLKLVADALFANGINHIIWHGKPHNPMNEDSIRFYASVHVGRDGNLSDEIPAFNNYLEKVSSILKKGNTYSDVAVYLPTEDAWMKGLMPKDKQFIWAWGYYEMRYVYFPEELAGYHPMWINREFLENVTFDNGMLNVGNASFSSLYVNVEYIDYNALKRINEFAKQGLSITLKQEPLESGTIKHSNWDNIIDSLTSLPNVTSHFKPANKPFIGGDNLPPYFARETNNALYVFFAHPKCNRLSFPLTYGQSFTKDTISKKVVINYQGATVKLELIFAPYQSLLYKIENGKAKQIDIKFEPKTPIVGDPVKKEDARWLVQ